MGRCQEQREGANGFKADKILLVTCSNTILRKNPFFIFYIEEIFMLVSRFFSCIFNSSFVSYFTPESEYEARQLTHRVFY